MWKSSSPQHGNKLFVLDPGSGAFLTHGSGIRIRDEKKSGYGMNIPDNFFESLETVLRVADT
jgi:hypothetical protein